MPNADSLSIPGLISQLGLAVDQNLASLGRDDAVSTEAELQRLLRGVHGHLNALSPINSLPPEMLATIFRKVVDSRVAPPVFSTERHSTQHTQPDWKRVEVIPLFRLAHVCQRWRSAALADAALWSHVDVSYPEVAVRFFLQCSSGYPLTLYASAEKASLAEKILEDHGARVRAVYLDRKHDEAATTAHRRAFQLGGHYQFHHGAAQFFAATPVNAGPPPILGPSSHFLDMATSQLAFHHFCSRAPQLECFALRQLKLGPGPLPFFGPDRGLSHIPSNSPLKALALHLSEAYFPKNSFPNLTHLSLSFPLRPSGNEGREKNLLEMLSRTPQLQFLQLSNLRTVTASPYEFVIGVPQVLPYPQVSLDHLRLLAFSGVQPEAAFNLLKYLTLPQSVLLSIECAEGSNLLNNGLPPSLRLPPIVQLNAATFMEISISTAFDEILLTGYDTLITSGFLFRTRNHRNFWTTTWLPQLHTMMTLSGITVLHINDNDGLVLPHLLPHFTQLEELSILLLPAMQGEAAMVRTARALFANLTPLTMLVCPALHFLGLEADIGHEAFPYAELHAMAIWRSQWGCAIRRFVYHWHGSQSPWLVRSEAEQRDILSRVEASLTPLLQPYVDSIAYRLSSVEGPLCPFDTPECWRVPGAETYWSSKTPSYRTAAAARCA